MSFFAVLDPYVMVWDKEDFLQDNSKYFLLASELIGLFEVIEESNIELILRQQMINEIVESFPAYEIANTFPQLKDVNFAFYSFISKINNRSIQFQSSPNSDVQSSPNMLKQHLSQSLKEEIIYMLVEMYNRSEVLFFTLARVWEGEYYLEISYNDYIKLITVLKSKEEIGNYLDKLKNKFEESPKHRELGGWDTILTTEIQTVISLLEDAVEGTGDSKALYNYSNSDGQFIVFRPHEKQKYHAYPVEANEVPSQVRKKLISRVNACGKRRRILKGNL